MPTPDSTRIIESHEYACDHRHDFRMRPYSRPAAGRQRLESLRSKSELLSALTHLLRCVLRLSNIGLRHRYNYIADRLRQIRQEMTIQGIDDLTMIAPQIRFHAVARDLFADDVAFVALNDALLTDCVDRVSDSNYGELWRISQGELIVRQRYMVLITGVVTCNYIQVFNFIKAMPYVQACLMLPLIGRFRCQYMARIKKSYRNPSRDLFCELLRCRPEQLDDDFTKLHNCPRDLLITNPDYDYQDGPALVDLVMPAAEDGILEKS